MRRRRPQAPPAPAPRPVVPRAGAAALGLLLAGAAGVPARAACPDAAAVEALAARLVAGRAGPAFGPGLTLADGACAQDKLVPVLARSWGEPVGYKVGLTNPAAQTRFATPHPLRGTLFADTLRARSGATVPARFGAVPVVESDLLVRVAGEGINEAQDHVAILRHLDQVIPFLELPDLVTAPGETLDGPNLLAINVGARLGVVGEPIAVEATEAFAARLGAMTVTLSDDVAEIAKAPGTALLGHPLNVLPWLAADLAARGRRLRVGDVVSLGGFSPAVPAVAGRTYVARYDGLAATPVEVTVRLR